MLLALLALHDGSHALDEGLETGLGELALVAVPQWIVLAVIAWVIVRGEHRRAAAAALVLGVGTLIGFVAVHLLPFSPADYYDLAPSPASWVLVWLPIPVATGLVVLAAREVRASSRVPQPTPLMPG